MDLGARVQHTGGAPQLVVAGPHDRVAVARHAGIQSTVCARRFVVGHLLDVGGHDDGGHRAACAGDAHGAIDDVRSLARVGDLREILAGDVLEERVQVDLLLEVAAQRHPLLLADDGDHGRVVELGVVEAVE